MIPPTATATQSKIINEKEEGEVNSKVEAEEEEYITTTIKTNWTNVNRRKRTNIHDIQRQRNT